MSLMGISVGATRCVAAAFRPDGRLLAQAGASYRPAVAADGGLDLDVASLWSGLLEAMRPVVAATPRDPVSALAVASAGEGLALLDGTGRPRGPVLVGVETESVRPDQRATPSSDNVAAHGGMESRGMAGDGGPGLLGWLGTHRPRAIGEAWRVVPLGTLVSTLLGGAALSDYTQAHAILPLETGRRTWSRELLAQCHVPARVLPELRPAGTPIGVVAASPSRDVGLSQRARLVLGGAETSTFALATGAAEAGAAALDLGGTTRLMPVFQALALDVLLAADSLEMAHHLVENLYLSEWASNATGRVLRWMRDHLAPCEAREARRRGIGVYELFLGTLPAEPSRAVVSFDDSEAGVSELTWRIAGLRADTTRDELVRALLEATAQKMAVALDRFRRAGVRIDLLRCAGPGAAYGRWLQLVADVLGVPCERVAAPEPAALGSALLAGLGSGVYTDLYDAVSQGVAVDLTCEPHPERSAAYARHAARREALAASLTEPRR